MTIKFTLENFDSLCKEWTILQQKIPSSHIFSTPEWCRTWWKIFGSGCELFLGAVYDNDKLIGISPLKINGDTATFIGSVDVCDYLDFIVEPGHEIPFFTALISEIKNRNIGTLDLFQLRPDSTVVTSLADVARNLDFNVFSESNDVSLYLNLPSNWDDYLTLLSRKQRHELKRKIRRISEIGSIQHRTIINAANADIDIFIELFKNSRKDKAAFLTPEMESFFRKLFTELVNTEVFRLNFTELNGQIIASTICFDYQNTVYLYNSGFNREYDWLSVGLISKALSIKDSIEKRKITYDFLRGNEDYKHHLGGIELPLYHYVISKV